MKNVDCTDCGQRHRLPTPRQVRFCHEYVIDLNATQAAIRSGFGKTHASSERQGLDLLRKPQVVCLIAKLTRAHQAELAIDARTVLGGLFTMATFDPAELVDEAGNPRKLRELPIAVRRALIGVEVAVKHGTNGDTTVTLHKVRLPDKVRAYDLLGKHLKLWTDVIQIQDQDEIRKLMDEGRRRAKMKDTPQSGARQ